MSDSPGEAPKIHVDSDWKAEAAAEKARLEEQTREQQAGGPLPEPQFIELINMIAMQAMIGLGGFQSPDGKRMAPDLMVAKHQIDLLGLLEEKTQGNLDDQEKSLLALTLNELQMRFVEVSQGPAQAPPPPPPEAT